MSKPFDLDELISRVKNLLALNRPVSDTVTGGNAVVPAHSKVKVGDVEVNFDTHEVISGGEPIKMTPKELKLLRYFIDHPHRVISRQELLSEVWDVSGNLQLARSISL